MGDNEHRGVANLDPKGMIGRIYVGDHLMLLHTKYLSSGPYGLREDFLSFSHISIWELISPGAWSILTLGAWLAEEEF